ncbi:hypothetical protein EW146_g306 [Bondarzewia mesenterica]|uniref:cystathionine gamma-lyase n=1 Tax=Bondarzewia mesenterica TaxID=1095465 RepID=A0A4S4M7E3_9AGAM|nr:hypothetical protein EW146_g306 [Bondarzewia mesenterica]
MDIIYPGRATRPPAARSSHAERCINIFVAAPQEVPHDRSFPCGGMISFRICDVLEEAQRFLKAMRLFALAQSFGGVESLAELSALMMHGSILPKEWE